jgi:hypothetical protein
MAGRYMGDPNSHEINILAIICMVISGGSWAKNSPGTFLKPAHLLMFHYTIMKTKSYISLSIFIMAK